MSIGQIGAVGRLGLTLGKGVPVPPAGYRFLTRTVAGVTYYLTRTIAGITYYEMRAV